MRDDKQGSTEVVKVSHGVWRVHMYIAVVRSVIFYDDWTNITWEEFKKSADVQKKEFSILRVTSAHDIQTNPFFKSYNIVLNATFRIA